ncbi:MAG TPA: hypothetical protein VIS71_10395, partial [Terrimicrobium sp.]
KIKGAGMSEEITSEMISRRATFSLLGAAAALSVAAPATPLTAAEAAFGIPGRIPKLARSCPFSEPDRKLFEHSEHFR